MTGLRESEQRNVELVVPERGHTDVTREELAALSADPDFWRLVERKLISIKYLSPGRVRLKGSSFVGSAILGGVRVRLVEKFPGALAALLPFADSRAFRLEALSADATELGNLMSLLIRQFLIEVRRYVANGREMSYGRRPEIGSLIGGRIDITRSIMLRARGLRHRLAFDRTVLSGNTLTNQIVFAAIREVDPLSRLVEMPRADIALARSLAMIFADCRVPEVLFAARSSLARRAEEAITSAANARDADMLALAALIVSHYSFERADPLAERVPRSWFLNLETLFEAAVRRTIRRILAPTVRVQAGVAEPHTLFDGAGDRYTVDPDIVLTDGRAPRCVLDVKYKSWTGSAGASDLYQLIAHAAAFDVRCAALIFPHDTAAVVDLGNAATGCHTWLAGVSFDHLERDLRIVLEQIGELTEGGH